MFPTSSLSLFYLNCYLLFFGGEAGCFGGEASPLPPMDRTLLGKNMDYNIVWKLFFIVHIIILNIDKYYDSSPLLCGC